MAPMAQAECSDTDFESSRYSPPDKNITPKQLYQTTISNKIHHQTYNKMNGNAISNKQIYDSNLMQNYHKGIFF